MFSSMGRKISGDTNDFFGLHRAEQMGFLQGDFSFAALKSAEYIAFDGTDFILKEPAVSRFFITVLISDDSHLIYFDKLMVLKKCITEGMALANYASTLRV
jgi:hypothetical protein